MATLSANNWEDIKLGIDFETDSINLTAVEIRNFASKFDPQPYHLDRDLAEASLFGGLCASGWHVCALMMKLVSDRLAQDRIPLLGSNHVPVLRWYLAVFEGDRISASITFKKKIKPKRKSNHGIIVSDIVVKNQNSKKVMVLTMNLMIAKNV